MVPTLRAGPASRRAAAADLLAAAVACAAADAHMATTDRGATHEPFHHTLLSVRHRPGHRRLLDDRAGRRAPASSASRRARVRQTAASAAADLAALASCRARLVGRPFVRGALLVRGAPALAGDFPLFLGRHRSEPAALLALGIGRKAIVTASFIGLSAPECDGSHDVRGWIRFGRRVLHGCGLGFVGRRFGTSADRADPGSRWFRGRAGPAHRADFRRLRPGRRSDMRSTAGLPIKPLCHGWRAPEAPASGWPARRYPRSASAPGRRLKRNTTPGRLQQYMSFPW